jgi:hypothetical protein
MRTRIIKTPARWVGFGGTRRDIKNGARVVVVVVGRTDGRTDARGTIYERSYETYASSARRGGRRARARANDGGAVCG